jgi:hypothetical protein
MTSVLPLRPFYQNTNAHRILCPRVAVVPGYVLFAAPPVSGATRCDDEWTNWVQEPSWCCMNTGTVDLGTRRYAEPHQWLLTSRREARLIKPKCNSTTHYDCNTASKMYRSKYCIKVPITLRAFKLFASEKINICLCLKSGVPFHNTDQTTSLNIIPPTSSQGQYASFLAYSLRNRLEASSLTPICISFGAEWLEFGMDGLDTLWMHNDGS